MTKQHIEQLLQSALEQLKSSGQLTIDIPRLQVEPTKDRQHGDFATNVALILAKPAKLNPRELAAQIIKHLPKSESIREVQIAGPGFINFFVEASARNNVITDILKQGDTFGCATFGQGKRVLVEFLSANPNGPMHVGHGRIGVYGSVVSALLKTIGYEVWREYYVNDAGRQMDILATSVLLRYLALTGEKMTLPANAYRGEYVIDVAKDFLQAENKKFVVSLTDLFSDLPPDEPDGGDREIFIDALIVRVKKLLGDTRYEHLFQFALDKILADIRADLADTGVHYENWFSERDFTKTDIVDKTIELLHAHKLTYEEEGALWFRATQFGDEKDRVLRRSNGVRTYFANDLAYHLNKFQRGFDSAVDVFGADHHGYVPRMRAGLEACDILPNRMNYLLVQFVTLYRGGQQVQMSTRSGSFVTLRELRDEVGVDATRFFYLMRKAGQHVDFDLDLAKSQSNDNPVYYIQYVHARICSVFRQLAEKNFTWSQSAGLSQIDHLTDEHETQLIATLQRYPDVILNAAQQFEPQMLTNYLRELAQDFHTYYNACVFLVEEEDLRNARLTLIAAIRQVLVNGFRILGISTPESM
ncbi:MAG: arginine--tRNA ligase [Gammaproteobacteria bacterium]|nr:arginine--tRNA ligase [Gammaproteobacteria bacterium]